MCILTGLWEILFNFVLFSRFFLSCDHLCATLLASRKNAHAQLSRAVKGFRNCSKGPTRQDRTPVMSVSIQARTTKSPVIRIERHFGPFSVREARHSAGDRERVSVEVGERWSVPDGCSSGTSQDHTQTQCV